MNTDDRVLADLIADMRTAAKHGYGAGTVWSAEERADYWSDVAYKCREALRTAADRLEAFHAKPVWEPVPSEEILEALRKARDTGASLRNVYDDMRRAALQSPPPVVPPMPESDDIQAMLAGSATSDQYEPVLDEAGNDTGYHRDKTTGEVVTLGDEYDDE